MDFSDYLIWKLIALLALVFVYQFWRGLNGLPTRQEPSEKSAPQEPGQRADR